ncbi:MAG: 6-phosphofructokinase [Thermoprotei archaeon]|nr:ATP-dependent 6-phosphofructokinase [TACK group archaeon]
MRIGVLTGGGDAPGLNAAIRAVVRRSMQYGYEVIGIKRGWAGLLDMDYVRLDRDAVSGILPKGGTMLGTSRTNPFSNEADQKKLVENIGKLGLDVIVSIGGDDTQSVSSKLSDLGFKVVGIPKTIDNDLYGTDRTFGFDTAVSIATEAIDRIHTTAESHQRTIVVEVMGRHAGWIALYSGLAGGADVILIPEEPFDVDEVCSMVKKRYEEGRKFAVVVVAEGAVPKGIPDFFTRSAEKDAFGHVRLGGIGEWLEKEIEKRTGIETRSVVLGHVQRGGSPTAFDRVLATRFGLAAVDAVKQGNLNVMVSLQGEKITTIPIKEAVKANRIVPEDMRWLAKAFSP